MQKSFTQKRILPPFPQGPQTLVARQIECIRCRELFSIAEDHPNRRIPSRDWQSPHDQYPTAAFRFDVNRAQVGVLPEVRSQPINPANPDEESQQSYHINCPRCGADNRNWLFVSENIRPYQADNVFIGGISSALLGLLALLYLLSPLVTEAYRNVLALPVTAVCLTLGGSFASILILKRWPPVGRIILSILGLASVVLLIFISASERDISKLDLIIAVTCLVLAGVLPLVIVPKLWPKVRNYQLTRRFLPELIEQEPYPGLLIVVVLYIAFILAIPGIKFGMIPIACYAVPICDQSGEGLTDAEQREAESALKLWGKLLYSGTLVSLVSSIFAMLAVNEIVANVNRHLPNPIYANTSNMVRVALWEAKRALEIRDDFHKIQWMMTRRNDLGGVDMEGCFRDPPEIMANGRPSEQVRRQVYTISTDRWCVIVRTRIDDDTGPRPAGGIYYDLPVLEETPLTVMSVSRTRY